MVGRPRVFATRELVGDALARLAREVDLEVWPRAEAPTPAELAHHLADADGLLCTLVDRVDRALLDRAPRLRALASCSVGLDHIDLAACTERGIPVGYTPGVLVETTAELAFALLLAAARRIVEADAFVRAGHWTPARRWEPAMLLGRDLHGATLGIVGLGAIGQAVARRALAFGMRVVAFNRTPRALPGVVLTSLDALLAESDFVSLHVALSSDTRHLLDAARLARMKPGAILVNTARGGIVDDAALAQALSHGALAAAGLDVFEGEPIDAHHPLLALPNVVVAPHIGSASIATRTRMAALSVENLLRGLAGEPMPHCANPPS